MTTPMSEDAKRWLADVPGENAFWCCDGRTMRNMQELADALSTVTDDAFACHANQQKNDFSIWVREVIGDEELAGDLLQASNRIAAAILVTRRAAFLADSLKPAKKAPQKKTSPKASRKKKR